MRILLLLLTGLLMACTPADTSGKDNPKPDNAGAPETEHDRLEQSLAGSEWSLNESGSVFVAFKADGKLIGNGGCNAINGSYEQDGTRLKIGPLATTRKMCPPDVMAIENKLLNGLEGTRFFMASHLNLSLSDADDTPLLFLKRADWD